MYIYIHIYIRIHRCTLFVWHQRSHDKTRVLRKEVVGFIASLIQPGKYTKDTWREHRTVVLPDMQGLVRFVCV